MMPSSTWVALFPRPTRQLSGNLNFIHNVALKAGSVVQWLILSTQVDQEGFRLCFGIRESLHILHVSVRAFAMYFVLQSFKKTHRGVFKWVWMCSPVVLVTKGMI